LFFSSTEAQNLNEKEIRASVAGFLSAIALYSNCKCTGIENLRMKTRISEMHDSRDLRDLMFNDLFSSSTSGGKLEDHLSWDEYLDNIETNFKNEIEVKFDPKNISVLNCIINDGADKFVFVTVDKSLRYKDIPEMTYTLLISVNLDDGYKIKDITSPRLYGGNCNIGSDNTDLSKEITILRSLANDYFAKKEYINARNLYRSLLEKLPTDLTAKGRLDECENYLSYQKLIDNAQLLITEKKYQEAKNVYTEALRKFPGNTNEIHLKIAFCDEQIKIEFLNKNIELGDYYYRVANFEQARKYYSTALSYKPNDPSTLLKIENSKKSDRSFVLQEIARAVRLAEAGKKNYGEAFRVMIEYEQSRLLTTENYYFLTVMMFKNNGDVKKEMSYSNEDCSNYLNIFVKKLKDKAVNERDYEMREKANFLFDEVINQRYQK
jgi:tetratricopeptide (TPR) repeat protein